MKIGNHEETAEPLFFFTDSAFKRAPCKQVTTYLACRSSFHKGSIAGSSFPDLKILLPDITCSVQDTDLNTTSRCQIPHISFFCCQIIDFNVTSHTKGVKMAIFCSVNDIYELGEVSALPTGHITSTAPISGLCLLANLLGNPGHATLLHEQ